MRSSASFLVLLLVAGFIGLVVITGRGGDKIAAADVTDPSQVTTVAAIDVAMSGQSGSTGVPAETAVTAADPSIPTPEARAETERQEWVTVPGTPIGLWPRPQSR